VGRAFARRDEKQVAKRNGGIDNRMNRKQITIVSVLAASALAVSTAFLMYQKTNGKKNVYKAIADDIFRDCNSKVIIVDDFWTHQYTEKMVSVAKGITSEQEKRFFIEECVN
jgi:hypothetical protein